MVDMLNDVGKFNSDNEKSNRDQLEQLLPEKKETRRISLKYCVLSNIVLLAGFLLYFTINQRVTAEAKPVEQDLSIPLDLVEVNLSSPENALRIQVVLEANTQEYRQWLESRKYQAADILIQIAQRKQREELSNLVQRNTFKRELMDELNYRLNSDKGRISGIYFAHFLLQ